MIISPCPDTQERQNVLKLIPSDFVFFHLHINSCNFISYFRQKGNKNLMKVLGG